ncbi:MAG: tRNA (N6-threonylcarbamoyladenosine(37)-N6)-methyltransferase TrmO, partial [Bulleidia sp.]
PLPHLEVHIPKQLQEQIPAEKLSVLISVLQSDPRPAYQHDPERIYRMEYAGMEIAFQVHDAVLEVIKISETR